MSILEHVAAHNTHGCSSGGCGGCGCACGCGCSGAGAGPCGGRLARAAAFANRASKNAIDYVEVSDDQLSVLVYFMGPVPALAGAGPDPRPHAGTGLTTANVRITGGEAVREIAVVALSAIGTSDGGATASDDAPGSAADEALPEAAALAVRVDRPGDFANYTIALGAPDGTGEWGPLPDFEPAFAQAAFSFKAGCPTDIDCVCQAPAPETTAPDPTIDYLAKDYSSFRGLLLDRLATTMPGWQERHAADVGIALVEVLAYAADELSYYQDAVATEAYLGTARQRISVRRHVRLVDYTLHEGLNARAWLTVWTNVQTEPLAANDVYFITPFPALKAGPGTVLTQAELAQLPTSGMQVFEAVNANGPDLVFRPAWNEIDIDTGGEVPCCLPAGSTQATLVDHFLWRRAHPEAPLPASWQGAVPDAPLGLAPGQVLILEEVRGEATGNPADASPDHRHAVLLTQVAGVADGGWLVHVSWHPDDALPFDLPLSTRTAAPDCAVVERMGVARGNTVLVDHGRTVTDPPWEPVPTETVVGECCCDGGAVEQTLLPGRIRPTLAQQPLAFADTPLPGGAGAALVRDPRKARAAVELSLTNPHDGTTAVWLPRTSLLESSPRERAFVVETDDGGQAHLRFGDGELGAIPEAGSVGTARYRVGNGPAGNVGRDSNTFMVLRNGSMGGAVVKPRNPLPASGGMAAETVAEARLLAPHEFRRTLLRAITAEDYAQLAGTAPELQRAAAAMDFTGSWYEAGVAIDPWNSENPPPQLLQDVAARLAPYRRMGHDLAVGAAAYVPIEVVLSICVAPHYVRGQVRAALLEVLGSGPGGMFHPDRLSFGTGVHVSALVAAAVSVPGVESAVVEALNRQGMPANNELANGVLPVGRPEIVQMENSPNFPDHGKLTLLLGGGL